MSLLFVMEMGDGRRRGDYRGRRDTNKAPTPLARSSDARRTWEFTVDVVRALLGKLEEASAEVATILRILQEYLRAETDRCLDEGIRLSIIGCRDRLHPALRETIAEAEALTCRGKNLHLRLAVDYSSRHCLFQAASKFYKATSLSTEAFSEVLSEVQRGGSTDVDLLIRTGGERRLSDFLLWECAFAEFVFLDKRWPDFTVLDLRNAVLEFEKRERTRGALPRECAS